MKLLKEDQFTASSWNTALLTRPDAHFLQSWEWGQFQRSLGHPTYYLAVSSENGIINQLLVIVLALPFGQCLLYAPKGNPVNKALSLTDQQTSSSLLLEEVRKIGKQHKAILFRVDPHIQITDTTTPNYYRSMGFLPNLHKSIQPHYSQILDLTKSEAELLGEMKQKTRYNINLAAKNHLTLSKGTDEKTISHFLKLTQATSDRQGFGIHSHNYYRKQIKLLGDHNLATVLLAQKNSSEPIAGIYVVTFGSTTTYVHGASADHDKELMAPYLLQWEAIKNAKSAGTKNYDFWGIHPSPHHNWAGITRFKTGFGGTSVEYINTLELPLIPLRYKIYSWVNKLK